MADISYERKKYLKRERNKFLTVNVLRITVLVAFIALWEALVDLKIIDGFLFSSPSRVVKTLGELLYSGELFDHVFTTLYETVLGFLIASVSGIAIAVIMWWSETVRKVLEPYTVVLNSLPKIALGPLIIIWFGAGVKAIVFMAIIITLIVTIINMLTGFIEVDENKINLLKSMGANKMQIFFNLILPASAPTLISTLKINVGMSWIGSIMGEYLVSKKGIGYLIVYGGQVFKLDLVMTSTIILCVLAGLMYLIVSVLEKRLLKWK